MQIKSQNKKIPKSNTEVYDFLTDLRNFKKLMPESIDKFEVLDPDTFLFALRGMPEIKLKRKDQTPHSQLVLGAASDKLPFTLTANITALSATESEVVLSFDGEFNAMMGMMIKTPITNFINTLSENMVKI